MKYTGPKAKKCRRQGTNLYGSDKYDRILQRKPYAPGKGPKDRSSRPSEYAKQLMEKQKMRDIYGLSERQFRSVYSKAARSKEQTGGAMQVLLERRLDNTIYRAGFALTRPQARQFIGHGLFMVDGVRVTSPSMVVREGMKIEIRPRSKQSPIFSSILAAHEKYMPPGWLKANGNDLSVEIVGLPTAEDSDQAVDVRQVIEFYSRN